MTYYYESELYHHGIKGQKWGIRRYRNEDGTLTEEGKRRYDAMSDDEKKYQELKNKPIESLSDAELQKLNNRQNLIQNHNRMNPKSFVKAVAFVTTTAATIGAVATLLNNSNTLIASTKRASKNVKEGLDSLKAGVGKAKDWIENKKDIVVDSNYLAQMEEYKKMFGL